MIPKVLTDRLMASILLPNEHHEILFPTRLSQSSGVNPKYRLKSGVYTMRLRLLSSTGVATAASLFPTLVHAGGSGLQIEASLNPWWTFATSTLPWWGGTIAIVIGALVLAFGGLAQGGTRMVSALGGVAIAAGAITWVVAGLGLAQGALLP